MFRRYGILLHGRKGSNLSSQIQWCVKTALRATHPESVHSGTASNEEGNCTGLGKKCIKLVGLLTALKTLATCWRESGEHSA